MTDTRGGGARAIRVGWPLYAWPTRARSDLASPKCGVTLQDQRAPARGDCTDGVCRESDAGFGDCHCGDVLDEPGQQGPTEGGGW